MSRIVGLNDLPEHRRDALLWFHALELDYDGVDDLVATAADSSCCAGVSQATCERWSPSSAMTGVSSTCRRSPAVRGRASPRAWRVPSPAVVSLVERSPGLPDPGPARHGRAPEGVRPWLADGPAHRHRVPGRTRAAPRPVPGGVGAARPHRLPRVQPVPGVRRHRRVAHPPADAGRDCGGRGHGEGAGRAGDSGSKGFAPPRLTACRAATRTALHEPGQSVCAPGYCEVRPPPHRTAGQT
jgi:hypothetical protein